LVRDRRAMRSELPRCSEVLSRCSGRPGAVDAECGGAVLCPRLGAPGSERASDRACALRSILRPSEEDAHALHWKDHLHQQRLRSPPAEISISTSRDYDTSTSVGALDMPTASTLSAASASAAAPASACASATTSSAAIASDGLKTNESGFRASATASRLS